MTARTYKGPWVSSGEDEYFVSVAAFPTMLSAVAEFISLNGVNSISTEDYLTEYGTPVQATLPMCMAQMWNHQCFSEGDDTPCPFRVDTLVWRSNPPGTSVPKQQEQP